MMEEKQKINTENLPAEELRTPESSLLPDARNLMFEGNTKEYLYQSVNQFELADFVPENIQHQYDTARNLFIYGYHVYRFYVVADKQLYSTLEFAIRECVGEDQLWLYLKQKRKEQKELKEKKGNISLGLRLYIGYLIEHKLIQNEDFPQWHHSRAQHAEHQYMLDVSKKMDEENLDSYTLDPDEIDLDAYHFDWDLTKVLSETIPALRNGLVHGSSSLYPGRIRHFEQTSIIINKMYERTRSLCD
jgi:hypothetical protein